MNAPPPFDLLMLGHLAKDRNVVDGVAKTESGGGVYFGSIAAQRLGARVAVVTRLHADDFARLDELAQEGIQVFATSAPETSGIENTYTSRDMERRVCKPLGFAGAFSLTDLPTVSARLYAIVPIIAGEVDLAMLHALAARGPVALDIQGFVRVRVGDALIFRPWQHIAEGLARVTCLKVDRAEAEALTGESDLARAAQRLSAYGPREIVLTENAGVTVYVEGKIYTAPFTPRALVGRTGRGDTCFASYLAKRLDASPAEACRWAGAVTTLKLEAPGPWRGAIADAQAIVTGGR